MREAMEKIDDLKTALTKLGNIDNFDLVKEAISEIIPKFEKPVLSTSLGPEDQVLTHLLCELGLDVRFFTLDTGRLFPSIYKTLADTEKKYGIKIELFFPDKEDLEKYVLENGINGFQRTVELRKMCCNIRKIKPLKRALLDGLSHKSDKPEPSDLWITGMRREQSELRQGLSMLEWDEKNGVDRETGNSGILKFHPLLNMDYQSILTYSKENDVPQSELVSKGFVSIGCAPCTRAIKAGEPFRAGRWWWEDESKKECGLHFG